MSTPTIINITPELLATGQLQMLPDGIAACIYLRPTTEQGATVEQRREECSDKHIQFTHIPFMPDTADAKLADTIVAAVSDAPRPLLIECASARRAGAAAALAIGRIQSKDIDAVQDHAAHLNLSYLTSDVLTSWVRQNL